MDKKDKKDDNFSKRKTTLDVTNETVEDATQYGEFISSYHSWLTSEGQKEKAQQLEKKIR